MPEVCREGVPLSIPGWSSRGTLDLSQHRSKQAIIFVSQLWLKPFILQTGTPRQGNSEVLKDPSRHIPHGSLLVSRGLPSSLSSRLSSFDSPLSSLKALSSPSRPLSLALQVPDSLQQQEGKHAWGRAAGKRRPCLPSPRGSRLWSMRW